MNIDRVTHATPELLEAMQHLTPQLSNSAAMVTMEQLETIISAPSNVFLVARLDGRIVGTLTLAIFPILTGLRAWIEDVIVDETVRGQGIGRALTQMAITSAQTAGATTVDLTSRPSRTAANALYQSMGFVVRETNVYRYTVE
jgi:ribosomal protein S18 acetylase RimI-like enzyme